MSGRLLLPQEGMSVVIYPASHQTDYHSSRGVLLECYVGQWAMQF